MSVYSVPPIIKAILGPTNTGKTHYAIERMLGRSSGCIGLPLRLLAREVYDRIVRMRGEKLCALITGEEKIVPPTACYFVCTVEAMPQSQRFAFVAIDEVQLAAHPERGHIFTDRLLHMRGYEETLFLGAENIRPLIRNLVPQAHHETRERFSTLSHIGHAKLTKLPKRSVIVAFSATEVYALAELMRRQRGGAAVVMGSLSPRTRNAQAELYQSGEVDFLIATDAVGMGLNLDTDHVAFASMRKFDGRRSRYLTPMEAGQIAGRAGRFRNDGTFGSAGKCPPFDEDMVGRIENHIFEPLRDLEWRNADLDTRSLDGLLDSLAAPTPHRGLRRITPTTDELSLERLAADDDIVDTLNTPHDVARLWEICQIPDFRDAGLDSHIRIISDIYSRLLENKGKLTEEWMAKKIARLNHVDGSIDTLSLRLMQIRTWTYVSNKANWLPDVEHWRARARAVEDKLSDALHERLIQKFVDRRTRALMKKLGSRNFMDAVISNEGDVTVEDHFVGKLAGLKFIIDPEAAGSEAKTLQATAEQAVAPEVNRRMTSMIGAQHAIFTLKPNGTIAWGEAEIGKLAPGKSLLHPTIDIIGAELGQTLLRDHLAARLGDFIQTEIRTKLEPLLKLEALTTSTDVVGEARGFAYRLFELNGLMPRRGNETLLSDLKNNARGDLRGVGVKFGQYYVYMPDLLKPAPGNLLSILMAFQKDGDGKPFIPYAGVTSIKMEKGYSEAAFNAAGYSGRGSRVLRIDILNRLGDTIRQAREESPTGRFQIAMEMMALLGSTYEECVEVLQNLGFKSLPAKPEEIKKGPQALAAEAAANAEEKTDAAPETAKDSETQDATAEAIKTEASETPDTPESAPAADAPEAAPAPATPNTIGSDGKPKHAMPAAPKKKTTKSKKGPRPLSYYEPVYDQDENGNDLRKAQDLVWIMPKRRHTAPRDAAAGEQNSSRGKPSGANRPEQDRSSKTAFRGKPRDNRKGGKGGKPNRASKPAMSAGPTKSNLADSPFAALAALKTPKKD